MSTIETLNHFSFDHGTIFTDLTLQASLSDRFQWYLVYKNKRYNLIFRSMDENLRYFGFEFGFRWSW